MTHNHAAPTGQQVDHMPTREGYDRWSEIYDAESNPLVVLEEPIVAELLGGVRGLAIADIGCGTGRHALRLAGLGARVTAVDFSEGMLAKARAKPGAERVRFIAHDLAVAPYPLETGAYDRAICCLVLDHIGSLRPLFAELRRIVRPGSPIVISVMHPAMMLRGVQARFTDPATGRETRPGSVPNQICDYVMAALAAGLAIEHMSEHIADAALAQKAPRAAKHQGWPLLLAMRLRA